MPSRKIAARSTSCVAKSAKWPAGSNNASRRRASPGCMGSDRPLLRFPRKFAQVPADASVRSGKMVRLWGKLYTFSRCPVAKMSAFRWRKRPSRGNLELLGKRVLLFERQRSQIMSGRWILSLVVVGFLGWSANAQPDPFEKIRLQSQKLTTEVNDALARARTLEGS